jgi:AcrR family transcriptional regulator
MRGPFPVYSGDVADTPDPTPLRADAARNRAAVVEAARRVFAERGLDAPLDEIARRACVGNATLYRRFPTRTELIEAVFLERIRDYAQAVDDALENPDPGEAFRTYVLRLFELQAEDRGLADLLVTHSGEPDDELDRLRAHGYRGVQKLIERAQAAGALRGDFTHQDLPLLLMANAGLVHRTATSAPGSWRRVATFVLDGLSAQSATPAPPPPSENEVEAAMVRSGCEAAMDR